MSFPRRMAEYDNRIIAAVATLNCDIPKALSNSWAVSQITTTFCSVVSVLCRMAHHKNRPSARCHRSTPAQSEKLSSEVEVPLTKAKGAMIRLKIGP